MTDFKPGFQATGIGSVPLAEPEPALELILDRLPHLPFWPQLVKRSPWEEMGLQFAPGLPGLAIDPTARLVGLDPSRDLATELTSFYEAALAGDLERFALTPEVAAGYFALVERIGRERGQVERLKGQVTGPVTLALSVKDATGQAVLFNPELAAALALGLGLKGAWQVRHFPAGLEPPLIFIDEPALTGFGSAFLALGRDEAIGLLDATAEPIHQAGALAGVHVCGNSDWSMVLASQIDVVNFDAFGFGPGFVLYPKEIAAFLERGGVIAWGLVPTLAFTGSETTESLITHLQGLLDHLASRGLNRSVLEEQSLLTPACGLGSLDLARATAILGLLAEASRCLRRAGAS